MAETPYPQVSWYATGTQQSISKLVWTTPECVNAGQGAGVVFAIQLAGDGHEGLLAEKVLGIVDAAVR